MSTTEKYDILQGCPLCAGMGEEEVKFFASYVQLKGMQRNELLFQEHHEGQDLYCIVSGEVDVIKGSRSFLRLNSGDVVGELAFLGDTSRTMTVVSKALTTLVVLTCEMYEQLADDDCRLALKIMRNVARITSERLKYTTLAAGKK